MTRDTALLVSGVLVMSLAVIGALLLVWRGPWWFDGAYLRAKDLRTGSAALVTGFRAAVVQLLAILGAGIALLFTGINYRLTRRGQVTDRFTKALERLGSEHLYVRYGGILAMEQIIKDAPEQIEDAASVLVAFVRERSPRSAAPHAQASRRDQIARVRRAVQREGGQRSAPLAEAVKPGHDVHLALTVLSKHRTQHEVMLGDVCLAKSDLSWLCLRLVRFYGADLTEAYFWGSDLEAAWFTRCNLTGACLSSTKLTHARFGSASLTNADLFQADLGSAYLFQADLTGANLSGANLASAQLLTVEQVLSARIDEETRLPEEISAHPDVVARLSES
ncbi:pentapeptide repeat-containing protein [Streptomyces sp. NPDC127197]|uniref:pentapeptide repeat-containing protein n=1 Tax=Streptomyces sp. NPDC127197 TaxID=3345388 RepID=UPI003642B8D2